VIEIINKSKWADSDIEKLVREVIDKTGSYGIAKSITIKTGRGANKSELDRQYTGYCFTDKKTITIMVPNVQFTTRRVGSDGSEKMVKSWTKFNPEGFAKVLTHEIHHLLGVDHNDMIDWWELDCSYAKDMEVRSKRMKRFHDAFGERFDAIF